MVTSSSGFLSEESVAQLCVEYWKLTKVTKKAIDSLPDNERRRLDAHLKFSDRQLEMLVNQLGLKLVEFEEEEFHAGLSVTVDNAWDYSEMDDLIVAKTLEPTVMADMKIIRPGRVLVKLATSIKD